MLGDIGTVEEDTSVIISGFFLLFVYIKVLLNVLNKSIGGMLIHI